MKKTFEYRLYPTRHQRELLMACLITSRHLYNEMLEQVREHYQHTGEFLFKSALTKRFKGRGGQHVPATTVQTLADRLDKALRRFLWCRGLGQKAGFPRFKSPNRWHSIQLRQYGSGRDVYLDPERKRLHVPKKLGSRIKVKQHRPLEGTPKTAHLVYRADAHWYVLVICDLAEAPEKRDGGAVGLDVGLTHFVADSDGNTIENPRCFRGRTRSSVERSARRRGGRRGLNAERKRQDKRPDSTSK